MTKISSIFMIRSSTIILICSLFLKFTVYAQTAINSSDYITYKVDPKKELVKLYWKNANQEPLQSLQQLKTHVESQHKKLLFAMNAGMYLPDNSPLGLFIENGMTRKNINLNNGNGNFYLKPNGIFYIKKNGSFNVCKSEEFNLQKDILFATQSGPMLVINGTIHPEFKQGSTRVNIRNGVGVLPNHQLIFVMSKKEVNLYDFASYFKQLGCVNALYLDGFVSRTYSPKDQWLQLDGNFGVMIGITEK